MRKRISAKDLVYTIGTKLSCVETRWFYSYRVAVLAKYEVSEITKTNAGYVRTTLTLLEPERYTGMASIKVKGLSNTDVRRTFNVISRPEVLQKKLKGDV